MIKEYKSPKIHDGMMRRKDAYKLLRQIYHGKEIIAIHSKKSSIFMDFLEYPYVKFRMECNSGVYHDKIDRSCIYMNYLSLWIGKLRIDLYD